MQSFNTLKLVEHNGSFEYLGKVAMLAGAGYSHSNKKMTWMYKIVQPAIKRGHIQLYENYRRDPVGYVIWANLSSYGESRLLKSGCWDMAPTDWNEGYNIWIVDLVATHGTAMTILRAFAEKLPKTISSIKYARERNGELICKEAQIR